MNGSPAPRSKCLAVATGRIALRSAICLGLALTAPAIADPEEPLFRDDIDVRVPHISTDTSVTLDYDIVYVRALRAGDEEHKRFYTDFSQPVTMEPGADLMLLRPDGTEELLVAGGDGSITDPMVSFDGEWVYYSHLYDLRKPDQWSPSPKGADIFKIHLKTRRIVKLTDQTFTPNTGAARWSDDFRTPQEGRTHYDYGVFNMGPCPLPGGRLVFTSNRDGFKPSKGYPAIALQLFVMDDSDEGLGTNIEKIGHINIAGALHPVVLADGRIMFSTLETQGIRGDILWGIWTIHPDGTHWQPLISAFDPGGAPNGFHFQTQLSDGTLVVEQYYNQNNSGFGAYVKLPASHPPGEPAFGPAHMESNKPWRYGRFYNARPKWYRMPFMPLGSVSLTPFSHGLEGPADESVLADKHSPAVGKFTHPSGAPDNHLLTVYSPGPVNHQYTHLPQLDGGIYLIKNGAAIEEPAQMRLIKNDPNYNEGWPRAVVPYERIYGIKEPKRLDPLANDGSLSRHLPEGTPFGLVGSPSLYKRESYPNGKVPPGTVTATYAGGDDPWRGLDAFTSHGNGMPLNFHNQGGDVGLYDNSDIVAVRILAMEPTTDRHRGANAGIRFHNHASERLRILGEVPVRKFGLPSKETVQGQPRDPDGQPDTSFLAKIPADTAFTFQTLDRRGMVLNASQTWHQLRPGEVRTNCGGCHAHSQKPTDFNLTAAARDDYKLWDLVNSTPMLTAKDHDEGNEKLDSEDKAGLRISKGGPVNVEYFRDIRPILDRSCTACHSGENPAGALDLDADSELIQHEHQGKFPGTYYRLALDEGAKFGHKPVGYDSWGYPNASRYIRKMQSRRSLLVWKIFGERLDGFSNNDHPSEPEPGAGYFARNGKRVPTDQARSQYDLDYNGKPMPPPDAVAGTYKAPDGRAIKVAALSDEDRFTIVRWIDLGCPVDLDHAAPQSLGWFLDDNRPVLTVSSPGAGANARLDRIVIGAHDYGSGLETDSLTVTADFAVNGIAAGENLAAKFQPLTQGVWELKLAEHFNKPVRGALTVSVKDKQGNVNRMERVFTVGDPALPPEIGPFPNRVILLAAFDTGTDPESKPKYWPGDFDIVTEKSGAPADSWWGVARAVPRKEGRGKWIRLEITPPRPVGERTKLRFRYHLTGARDMTVQIFDATDQDNRHIRLNDLPQGVWTTRYLDFTANAKRNDGSATPFAAGHLVDDLFFFIEPDGPQEPELFVDELVLFDAGK